MKNIFILPSKRNRLRFQLVKVCQFHLKILNPKSLWPWTNPQRLKTILHKSRSSRIIQVMIRLPSWSINLNSRHLFNPQMRNKETLFHWKMNNPSSTNDNNHQLYQTKTTKSPPKLPRETNKRKIKRVLLIPWDNINYLRQPLKRSTINSINHTKS
jgi:hypothetical protein